MHRGGLGKGRAGGLASPGRGVRGQGRFGGGNRGSPRLGALRGGQDGEFCLLFSSLMALPCSQRHHPAIRGAAWAGGRRPTSPTHVLHQPLSGLFFCLWEGSTRSPSKHGGQEHDALGTISQQGAAGRDGGAGAASANATRAGRYQPSPAFRWEADKGTIRLL